jgi:DNA-binding transcriptional MerR regulator
LTTASGVIEQETLMSIGAAAQSAGVTERALRYYQELGLINPGVTAGGSRRYSRHDLERVERIRELQALLGFNLDEIAVVLANEDRTAAIKEAYLDEETPDSRRRHLLEESLELANQMRRTVEAKRLALDSFLDDLDQRINRIRAKMADT